MYRPYKLGFSIQYRIPGYLYYNVYGFLPCLNNQTNCILTFHYDISLEIIPFINIYFILQLIC